MMRLILKDENEEGRSFSLSFEGDSPKEFRDTLGVLGWHGAVRRPSFRWTYHIKHGLKLTGDKLMAVRIPLDQELEASFTAYDSNQRETRVESVEFVSDDTTKVIVTKSREEPDDKCRFLLYPVGITTESIRFGVRVDAEFGPGVTTVEVYDFCDVVQGEPGQAVELAMSFGAFRPKGPPPEPPATGGETTPPAETGGETTPPSEQ